VRAVAVIVLNVPSPAKHQQWARGPVIWGGLVTSDSKLLLGQEQHLESWNPLKVAIKRHHGQIPLQGGSSNQRIDIANKLTTTQLQSDLGVALHNRVGKKIRPNAAEQGSECCKPLGVIGEALDVLDDFPLHQKARRCFSALDPGSDQGHSPRAVVQKGSQYRSI
jgi:hypothetical protein